MALLNRPQHARQHGVRLGAAFGSIAAARHAHDHGRAQGVFGTPIGGVNGIGFEEKGKYRREFDGQMRRESAGDSGGPGVIDQRVELVFQMPAGNCQPGADMRPCWYRSRTWSACWRMRWTCGAKRCSR